MIEVEAVYMNVEQFQKNMREIGMGTVLKMNELNQLGKGTKLFSKDETIQCIGMIIKGSIRIQGNGIQRIAKKGEIIAVKDMYVNQYLADYITEEDTVFYTIPAVNTSLLDAFFTNNAEYRGIVVYSMALELADYLKERENLLVFATKVFEHCGNNGDEAPRAAFQLESGEDRVSCYQELVNIPLEIHKKYYTGSKLVALYQSSEIADVIQEVLTSYQSTLKFIEEMYYLRTGSKLYDNAALVNLNYLAAKFKEIIQVQKKEEDKPSEVNTAEIENPIPLLKNSLFQIMKFAKMPDTAQKEVAASIHAFVNAGDRLSTQDDIRKIKKQITNQFYDLYKLCIFQWFEDENVPLAVNLFLHYGFIDERLLDENQIEYICKMFHTKNEKFDCQIYTIPEWLKEIYMGRKEPSRNSFEQDYRDVLREQKRTGDITESQEKEYLEDGRRKVIFEIDNMFISNNKIVNGKLSTYVPILYKDEIFGSLDRLYLTKRNLYDAIIELEKKDFTIFNREVLYSNPELKIEREQVIKHVYPDIIMMPVYGTASSMWQEITGKKRDTPGRFIFPTITETEVDKLVTKVFGRFHWEYCRCEQGVFWNNIQYKSLTSEYMDYIQYYRKNHELSEEKREKIKLQILRARNNSREIFLSDYELWIYNESKSAIKLNKVSRAILATYCPFSKEIREYLKTNAAIAEAMTRQQRAFAEQSKLWDMRIKRRENNGLKVPDEFYATYNYYANN